MTGAKIIGRKMLEAYYMTEGNVLVWEQVANGKGKEETCVCFWRSPLCRTMSRILLEFGVSLFLLVSPWLGVNGGFLTSVYLGHSRDSEGARTR